MAFETFTAGRKITKEPRVSILKQGNFGLNSGVTMLLKENAVTHVQLLFDKETNRIAFKPCTPETAGAYIIRGVKGAGQISGMAFLKNYAISYGTETRSYPAVWQDNMLIISLN